MIRAVILHTGYVESSSVGTVLFVPLEDVVFETPAEAVKSLITGIFTAWFEHEKSYSKKLVCCKQGYGPSANFCVKCGKELKNSTSDEPTEEDMEEFREYVKNLPRIDVDSFSISEDIIGWTPWASISQLLPITKEELVEVSYAEELAVAIADKEIQKEFCVNWHSQHDWQPENKAFDTFDKILAYELRDRSI